MRYLSKVLPVPSKIDAFYACIGDAVSYGQFILCCSCGEKVNNLNNLRLGKLGCPGTLAFRPIATPLLYAIRYILCLCSESKVRRIHALRPIAEMHYYHSVWDLLVVGDPPGYSVGQVSFVLECCPSVSAIHCAIAPIPTLVRFADVDSAPEVPLWVIDSAVVAMNVAQGLTLDPALRGVRFRREIGLASAAAVALTIGYFAVFWVILHSAEILRRSWPSPRTFERRWDNFMRGFNYTMEWANA